MKGAEGHLITDFYIVRHVLQPSMSPPAGHQTECKACICVCVCRHSHIHTCSYEASSLEGTRKHLTDNVKNKVSLFQS